MQDSLLQWFAQRFMDRQLSPRELLTARKVVYIGLVLLLFAGSFLWRRNVVEARAADLAILEQTHGDVELSGSLVRLTLTGSRGLATCALWINAIEKQKKNQWNELEFYVGALTKLQPHFITPWLFQSWNLAYNVSVESDRPFDKYFYIARGIQLQAEGERRNQNNPEMRFYVGFYLQHKVCLSDETNVMRSLLQLSMIPPSERDPARFRKREADGTESINWEELERFCKENPKLIHRLAVGIRREDEREQRRQFVCVRPEAVLEFLSKNWRLPSRFQEIAMTAKNAEWTRADAVLLPSNQRFPPLPPERKDKIQAPQELFRPAYNFAELTNDSVLNDTIDGQAIARAWYGYAQEPVPPPGDLPGSTQTPTDPVRQRKPKQMATLLFRQYPALTQTHLCQDLQQEGWFDTEPWPIPNWFETQGNRFTSGELAAVAVPEGAATEAQWRNCEAMWRKHAEVNHMIVEPAARQINMMRDADAYWQAEGMSRFADPLRSADLTLTETEARKSPEEREQLVKERERLLPDEKRRRLVESATAEMLAESPEEAKLPADERARREQLREQRVREFNAALFLYELNLYKSISNFEHHYYVAGVEKLPETVTARKLFAEATLWHFQASDDRALATYLDPRAMYSWRDKVLAWPQFDEHREYRDDNYVQETTCEVQLDYRKLAEEKEEQYRRRILNTALTLSQLSQGTLAHAGQFSPVPLDLLLAAQMQNQLRQHTFFPRPFEVPVLNLTTLVAFVPSFAGAAIPGTVTSVGLAALTSGATRPLISEGVRMTIQNRRNPAQAIPAQPAGQPATPSTSAP